MRSDGRSCGGARQAKRSVRAVCMGNNLYPCRVRPCGRNAGSQHTAHPRAAEERISAEIADLRAERQRVGRWHRRGGITGRHCERLLHTGCAAQKSARAGRASAQTATGSAQRTESTKTDGSTRTPVGQAAVRRKFSDGMPQCRLHPAARHSRLDIRDGAVHCAAHRSRLCPQRAGDGPDRKSTRLNSSHQIISYAVFCLKQKKKSCGAKRDNKAQPPDTPRPPLSGRGKKSGKLRLEDTVQSKRRIEVLFFFTDTATTEIYTLSLHDALPISHRHRPSAATTPPPAPFRAEQRLDETRDRKSTRLNSSHQIISYAVFCLKK